MDTSHSLLDRLAAAPSDADWRRLDALYRPLLLRWADRAGLPAADADDLAQDVLLVVVREVGGFRPAGPGAFRGWLRCVLANRLKAHFKKRAAAPARLADELADPAAPLSREWDRDHDLHVAARLLARVRPDFAPATWAAFRRQVLDGARPAAAAAELGLSLNAVLLAKSRVLKRLREEAAGLLE